MKYEHGWHYVTRRSHILTLASAGHKEDAIVDPDWAKGLPVPFYGYARVVDGRVVDTIVENETKGPEHLAKRPQDEPENWARFNGYTVHEDFDDMWQFSKEEKGWMVCVENIGFARAGWYATATSEPNAEGMLTLKSLGEDMTLGQAHGRAETFLKLVREGSVPVQPAPE